ncbi:Gti1/Pac2 family-domain-containing protein, partial [Cyathus striatus]
MQHPTCTNTRIRSTHDAHKIFYAIQQGLLQMVTRRLDSDEREALCSGCIYVWEERGPQSEITGLGIERFTEGRRWSPSRVRDEFLFYYEKTPAKDVAHLGASSERHPLGDWHQLVKQTYSVWVETDKGRRKWHLTAYFTQEDIDQLGTVDDIPSVRDLVVPDGHFKSTRVGKSRSKTDDSNARAGEPSKPSTVTRTYAPFPSPYP